MRTTNATTKTTNKGCCATCVTRLVWHETRGDKLVYLYCGTETVVGVAKNPEDGRSTRFYCLNHTTNREVL